MTPELCCGFECGGYFHFIADDGFGASSFSTTPGFVRSGSRSLRVHLVAPFEPGGIIVSGFSSDTRHVGRVYMYFQTLPSADCVLVAFGTGQEGPLVRFKQSDSKIYAAVGTGNGTAGVSVVTAQWYCVDYNFLKNSAGSDFSDVQVDGIATSQATGVGSDPVSLVDKMGLQSICAGQVFLDDLLISSTAADYPLGEGSVGCFVPVSDGTHNIAGASDFEIGTGGVDITNATTDAFELVNDIPLPTTTVGNDAINMIAPPNATDYVECVFGPAPGTSAPTVAPRAVEVIVAIQQAGTGLGNIEIRLNDNGTNDVMYTATGVAGATQPIYKRKHYPSGPAGAWVIGGGGNGDFTDLRVRFGSPSALDVNPDQYFGAIMIEAEFPSAPPPAFDPSIFNLRTQNQIRQLLAQ